MVREKPYKNKEQKLEKNYKEQGEQMNTKLFRFPLNIQTFAENNGDGNPNGAGGGEKTPDEKTYSAEEYNSLLKEIEKQKKLKDDYAKENAKYKENEKAKLSEDEKLKQNYEETQKEIERLNGELRKTNLSKEFVSMGFDEKSSTKLIESYEKNKDNIVDFVKDLGIEINKRIDSVRKEEQTKFNRGTTLPPNGGQKSSFGNDPTFTQLLNEQKNGSKNNARDYYLNKK